MVDQLDVADRRVPRAEDRPDIAVVEAHEVNAMGEPDGEQVGEVWGDGNPAWKPVLTRTSDDD